MLQLTLIPNLFCLSFVTSDQKLGHLRIIRQKYVQQKLK